MAELSREDAELLGLDDDDLEVLADVELPEQPDVELTGEEQDALGWAERRREGDLRRVADLDDEQIRYLSEPSKGRVMVVDPFTDGLEHEGPFETEDDAEATDELRRRFNEMAQPDGLLEADPFLDLIDLEDLGVRAAVTGGVRLPGATWAPFTAREVSSTPLIGPRAVIEHTMVGTMGGSWSYHNRPGMAYAHGYRDGIGNCLQAQGLDRRAAATLEGNPYVIAFENEDYGRWFPDAGRTCGTIPPFREEQLRRIVVDDAFCCVRFGIPAVLMADSCAATRGIGYHRLGIYPWRKSGCLIYSNADYKCCPDVARIAQMPGIVRAVAAIVDGVTPTPIPTPVTEDHPMLVQYSNGAVLLAGGKLIRVTSPDVLSNAVAGEGNMIYLDARPDDELYQRLIKAFGQPVDV
jgi:hypothetical protein